MKKNNIKKQSIVVICGVKNSGKTTLFNALTGANQYVGNWPGVTVDKVIGTLDYVNVIAGASDKTLQEDGSLEVEIQVMTGATNETGFNVLSAR